MTAATKNVSVKLDSKLYTALKTRAELNGSNVSDEIRSLLRSALATEGLDLYGNEVADFIRGVVDARMDVAALDIERKLDHFRKPLPCLRPLPKLRVVASQVKARTKPVGVQLRLFAYQLHGGIQVAVAFFHELSHQHIKTFLWRFAQYVFHVAHSLWVQLGIVGKLGEQGLCFQIIGIVAEQLDTGLVRFVFVGNALKHVQRNFLGAGTPKPRVCGLGALLTHIRRAGNGALRIPALLLWKNACDIEKKKPERRCCRWGDGPHASGGCGYSCPALWSEIAESNRAERKASNLPDALKVAQL